MARPIEIATLGHAPVMGQSTSAGELKYNFEHNQPIMRQAARKIGLTPGQFEQVRMAIEVPKPNWVTVPRHLDVMTWGAGGVVHTLRDVIIPANQKGMEVDLHTKDEIITVYLPAKCGNLSLNRHAATHLASTKNFPVPHPRIVTVLATPPPTPTPVAYVPSPEPSPQVAAVLPPVAAAAHHFSLVPLLGLIPFLFGGGGGGNNDTTPGGGSTVVGTPPCP